MVLDSYTLLLVLVLCNLVMAGALWIAFAGAIRDGLAKWGSSLLAQAAAWALFVAGDTPAGTGILVSAHFLLATSFMLQAGALIDFQRRTVSLRLLLVPPILVAISYAIFSGYPLLRDAIDNLLQGFCCLCVIRQLAHNDLSGQRRTRMPMLLAFGALATMFAARAVAALVAPEMVVSLVEDSSSQGIGFLLGSAIVVLTSFGFLLMHKERAEEEMHKLATMDPLTGVFNRRTFIELADRELARCRRSNSPIRLLMMDLDHFKRVNDTLGHMVGDDVLREFSRVVTDCLRREDLLVRYGGEEFCVLLPNADAGTALTLADRIRATIDNTRMQTRRGEVHVTTSIGICGDDANAIDSIDSLLSCADGALYLAKAAGRNQVVSSLFKQGNDAFTEEASRQL